MKILIASDIHGALEPLLLLEKRIVQINPDKIFLLGDYLGGSSTVSEVLNRHGDIITAVKGNCDTFSTQNMLNFPMLDEYRTVSADGYTFFLSHGNRWNWDNPPPLGSGDFVLFGHSHVPCLQQGQSGALFVNPGSLSLPRQGTEKSFAVYDDGSVGIIGLYDGKVIASCKLHKA